MRSVVCKAYGSIESLTLESSPDLRAEPGQVVVDVRAAGVNFPDVLIVQGKYQLKPDPPFTPGGEIAGVVREVGAGVTGVRPGERVVALMPWGGFAEQVAVLPEQCLPVPDGVDDATAAGFLLVYGTGYHALHDRAALRAGETLVVLGAAGGAGLAAVDLGKAMGARVVAVASTDAKLEACRALGADVLVNYGRDDLRAALRAAAPDGADVVYDAVGGPHSEVAFRSLGWGGRHLVVGFASGEIPKLPLNLALLKGASIVGVFWGDFARREPKAFAESVAQLGRWHAEGKLRPHVSKTFPLEKAVDALKMMEARQVKGKVVLTVGKA